MDMFVGVMSWLLGAAILGSCIFAAVHSYRSRRAADLRQRGADAARMNIALGVLLVALALLLMLVFNGSSIRVIVCAAFFLLGLFNLFAGLRNLAHYSRRPAPDEQPKADSQ